MLSEKQRQLIENYSREMYLWDDPSEAPSVPSEDTLVKFIKEPEKLDSDLVHQIETDINCRAALRKLERKSSGVEKGFSLSDEEMRKIMDSLPAPSEKLNIGKKAGKSVYVPQKGDIFYTKSKLKVFDNGRNYCVYTFLPQAVLLLDNGNKMPWGRIFRCVVVTPDYAGDAVAGQDMELENGWILHKWLCYPLSFSQIDCTRKVASVDNIDEIAPVVNDYFFSENKMTRYGREERRLMAKADYVPAMADAEMARAEWQNEHLVSVDELKKYESVPFRKSAAGDEEVSRIVVRKGDLAVGHFAAALDSAIRLDAGSCEKLEQEHELPTWSVDKDAAVPDGMVFVLRDLRNGNNIGFGEIRKGVANLEHLIPEALFLPVTAASQVVLEVYVPW